MVDLHFPSGEQVLAHTRDISAEGCFLRAPYPVHAGNTLEMTVQTAEATIPLTGSIARLLPSIEGQLHGFGVRIDDPPESWLNLVSSLLRNRTATIADRPSVLVVADIAQRQQIVSRYVGTEWDVEFSFEFEKTKRVLSNREFDAILLDIDTFERRWERTLAAARSVQPKALRWVKSSHPAEYPKSVAVKTLVDQFVDNGAGPDEINGLLSAE